MKTKTFAFDEWQKSLRLPYLLSSTAAGIRRWMGSARVTLGNSPKRGKKIFPLYLLPLFHKHGSFFSSSNSNTHSSAFTKENGSHHSNGNTSSLTAEVETSERNTSSITPNGTPLPPTVKKIEPLVRQILIELGQDVTSEDMRETPLRNAKALVEMFVPAPFKFTEFKNTIGYKEMILVRNIPYFSTCPHHLLQIRGEATVAYIPSDHYAGLSKVPRTVTYNSHGAKTQEQITLDIANFIHEKIKPKGVAVYLDGVHSCMACRGTRMPQVSTETYSLTGVFETDNNKRMEFFSRINKH